MSGVGFSNGWAELMLKNPPPLVPSCLMAIWRGGRAHRDRLGGHPRAYRGPNGSQQGRPSAYAPKVCTDAL